MSQRDYPLQRNKFYHIYNNTLDNRKLFLSSAHCIQFYQLLKYYRSSKVAMSFSTTSKLKDKKRQSMFVELSYKKYHYADILAFCFISNQYHLILRQRTHNGISRYISKVVNAFTKYVNMLYKRSGPLFCSSFKSNYIADQQQLLHTSKFIHTAPMRAKLIAHTDQLNKYPWSSFNEYTSHKHEDLCQTTFILRQFGYDRILYDEYIKTHLL